MGLWMLTKKESENLIRFLRKLVQTSSLSGDEGRVANLIMDEMRKIGYDDVAMDEAGNVVGRIGPSTGPAMMFNSHMDTVDIADEDSWTVDPFGAELKDGNLYGLGSCDMKAGLAATVYAGELLKRNDTALKGPVYVAAVGLEEPSEGTGTRKLLQELRITPHWVVIAEPSDMQIVRAQKGHMEMRVIVKGTSSHSSRPELGKNAVYDAARLIYGLEILAHDLGEDSFLGSGVLAVTYVTSRAVSRNAVPHSCEFIIDRRLTVGETESKALSEVERIITREGVNAEVRIIEESVTSHTGQVLQARRVSLPWSFDERHPLIQATVKAVSDIGHRPTVTRWLFATEGAYTASVAQIPTVGLGPGNPALAHACDEYVPISQVYSATRAYAALAHDLLG
jgi:putative selenium metabolism hydrolase